MLEGVLSMALSSEDSVVQNDIMIKETRRISTRIKEKIINICSYEGKDVRFNTHF